MPQYLKDPDAVLDFVVDWSDWLVAGDSIVESEWISEGLTTATPSLDGAKATVWLSGGTVGTTYKVTNRVTTSAGRIDDRTLEVLVIER